MVFKVVEWDMMQLVCTAGYFINFSFKCILQVDPHNKHTSIPTFRELNRTQVTYPPIFGNDPTVIKVSKCSFYTKVLRDLIAEEP